MSCGWGGRCAVGAGGGFLGVRLDGCVVLGGFGLGYEDRWELTVVPEEVRMAIEVIEAGVRSGEIGERVVL